MGLKKNIIYNSVLTLSNYIFGIILLPYISRVLGVGNVGAVDFITNIVSYTIVIASLGIPTIGIRIISKNKESKDLLNHSFSSLFSLNAIYTICALVIFSIISFNVELLSTYRPLLFIGAIHILASPFLIEWLYKGLEKFKYITIRNIIVRCIYVILVLVFVKDKEDFVVYYGLTVGTIVVNAIINIHHASKFVRFSFIGIKPFQYFNGSIRFGVYLLVTSMYTTLSIAYLGFCTNAIQVGYYSTAIKIYTIIVGFFSAFTTVVMSRSSALVAHNDNDKHKSIVDKSLNFILSISIPIIIVCEVLAPQIIMVIGGEEFMPAVGICRIIMPLILLVGIDQILAYQILIPLEKDNWILQASIIGAIVGCILNIVLVDDFLAKGTAYALLFTEVVLCIYYTSMINHKKIHRINFLPHLCKQLCHGIPYLLICVTIQYFTDKVWVIVGLCVPLCFVYFIIDQLFILKNDIFIGLISNKR